MLICFNILRECTLASLGHTKCVPCMTDQESTFLSLENSKRVSVQIVPRAGLSAHFKVDGAFGRVDGENDYIYYARNIKI